MPCLDPIGLSTEHGRTVAYSHRKDAWEAGGQYSETTCGKCMACRAAHARDWAVRSYCETRRPAAGVRDRACFITLTYDPEYLPPGGELEKTDWQNFAKRLRRSHGRFRYLHCGEYGERTHRAHYHAAIWGIDFTEDRTVFSDRGGHKTYISESLADTWGLGFCTVAPLTFASARYVAGYVVKKLRNDRWEGEHAVYGNTDQPFWVTQPPYITMSTRPGLGAAYFDEFWSDIYPRDHITIEGKQYRPPQYFDKLLQRTQPVLYDQVVQKRQEFAGRDGRTTDRVAKARASIFIKRYGLTVKRDVI